MEGKSGNAEYKPPSVAELAGRFKKQTSSTPSTGKEEKRICPPVQKRPPCSLNLQNNVFKEEIAPNSEEKRVCPPVHKKPPCCLNLQNNPVKEKVSHKAEEKHVCPPVHKKPPCSLNLQAYMAKEELSPNGEEKAADGGISQASKVKSKLSPGIGKLQTNLNFDPAALRPGGPPKSPGLKLVHSPNISPASTPTTPPTPTTLSQPIHDEVPVGFENPPEGAPLQSFNKGRTRLSMKRRPPSRKHRRSVTDDSEDIGIIDTKDKTAESSEKVALNEEKVSTTQEEKPLQEQPQAGKDSNRNEADMGPAEEVLEDSGVFVEEKKKEEDEKTPSKDVEETGKDEPDGTVTCQEEISDEKASQSQEPICQDLTESSEVVTSEVLENKENTGQTTDDCSPVNEQNSENKPDMEVASTQDTEN